MKRPGLTAGAFCLRQRALPRPGEARLARVKNADGRRVGNEVRTWEAGKLLIFDIWRPELSDREKQELTLLFSD